MSRFLYKLSCLVFALPISLCSQTCLDSAAKDFLEEFSRMFGSIAHLSIPEQRAVVREMFIACKGVPEPVARVEDKVIPGRNGTINIRLFFPKSEGPLPILVYYHGGGWVYGSIDQSEASCRRLANGIGAIIAAVEYRLSPEHKFPIPLQDCYDATKWVAENAASF